MTNEELILAQYKLYSESKEKFIDRTFSTNKFYMIFVVAIMLIVFLTSGLSFGKISAPSIFSVVGLLACVLWWLNMDSYNCLIKIKFSKVLEEMEKQLPLQPYALEYKALRDFRIHKKSFLFSDIQKIFAILSFLAFFVIFMIEVVPKIINCGL